MRSARTSRSRLLDLDAFRHAEAAEHLHRLVDHHLGVLSGVELGHRGLAGDARRALVLGPGGPVDEQRRGVDRHRHVGERGLRHLKVAEGRAEHDLAAARAGTASARARRANPSAAAPTVERNTSRVAMATLKPSPGAPTGAKRHPAAVELQRRERMRGDHLDALGDSSPGVPASTTKAERPLAPGASPERAKTT